MFENWFPRFSLQPFSLSALFFFVLKD